MMNSSSSSSYGEALKRRWEDHHHRRTQQQQQINIMQQQQQQQQGSDTINHNNNNNNFGYYYGGNNNSNNNRLFQGWFTNNNKNVLEEEEVVLSRVVPAVTVVVEGRSICQRISLQKHGSYESLAKALRQMFVEEETTDHDQLHLDLSNAIPGHLIAYEDIDNDLLLAGDLSWKDFVRVAKRIRILPAKGNSSSSSRKGTSTRSGE